MRLTLIIMLALLTACGHDDYIPGVHRDQVMADLQIAESDLENTEAVVALVRDYVYANNIGPDNWPLFPPFGPVTPVDDGGDFYNQYLQWKAGNVRYQCGELGYVQAFLLEELGIPARGVALATADYPEDIYTTHVTTEAFYNGKWIVSDATFNVTFQCDGGDDLGIVEMRACLDNGGTLTSERGVTSRPTLTLEEYWYPFDDLLYSYQIGFAYPSRL